MYKAVGRSEHMGEGGRSVNPISTRRVDYTNQITTCSPDFQTFLHWCRVGAVKTDLFEEGRIFKFNLLGFF